MGHAVPRIFTPPKVAGPEGPCGCGCALTDATTRGFSVVDFAREILGVTLRPWQRWLLIHGLETLPGGSFRFRNLVILVARQNGKSTLSVVLSLWAMYVRGTRVVLSTAQDLDTAEEIWQQGVYTVTERDEDDQPVRPELAAFLHHVRLENGKKALILSSGERWKVKAANRKAGRGLSGDLIILDELREHQTWFAWSAITKTTMARPEALVWCFSNAGDATSVVLRHLRLLAHEALGDPDGICAAEAAEATAPTDFDVDQAVDVDPELDGLEADDLEVDVDDLFLAEWSATPGKSKWDREGWAQSNPSLGYGDTTEKAIASACRTDPEWEFRTEVLCQWPDGALQGVFDAGSWEATTNTPAETPSGEQYVAEADRLAGDVVAAFDVSKDGSRTYIAFAGQRSDGVAQVEVMAAQPGTDWVGDWLHQHRSRIECVVAQERGAPASDVLAQLRERPRFSIPIIGIGGSDLTATHGRVKGLLRDGKLRHNRQPVLDQAAALAVTRPLGDNEVLDRRRSPVDVAPLAAFEFAAYQLTQPSVPQKPPPPPPKALAREPGTKTSDDFDVMNVRF